MKFINGEDIVYLYPDRRLVFMNGEMFPMVDVALFTNDRAKFSFFEYDAKILGPRLTLISRATKVLYKTFMRADGGSGSGGVSTEPIVVTEGERVFRITQTKSVSLVDDVLVKYLGEEYPVKKKYKRGVRDVYDTKVGELVVSNFDTFKSTWLGVSVQEVKD